MPVKKRLVPSIVIIRGAVSPAILDMAITIPVRIPSVAAGSTMNNVILVLESPS